MTHFREIEDRDVEAVVALWQACGLTRAWNDPYKDIAFARAGHESTVLVHEFDGHIIATVMASGRSTCWCAPRIPPSRASTNRSATR